MISDKTLKIEQCPLNLKEKFRKSIVNSHVMAQNPITKNSDLEALVSESLETIDSLYPKDNIQMMLASQMTSIHNFQQKIMSYAVMLTS